MASMGNIFTVDASDPDFIAALDAEQRLFAYYGIEAKSQYVELPGLGIKLRISGMGSGKPVVIIPGNVGEAFPLAPLMAELKGRRIIAVNRPGGGGSDGVNYLNVDFREFTVRWITALLDILKLDKVPIIAHSIGGHMSLLMALDKPERVSALVLPGVPGQVPGTKPPIFISALAIPGLDRIISIFSRQKPGRPLGTLTLMGHSQSTVDRLPGTMADCYYHFGRIPNAKALSRSFVRCLLRPGVRLTPEQLSGIRQPAIFLWGTNDNFSTVAKGQKVAGMLPAACFISIQGGGHLPWLDSPAECGRLIRAFLSDY
jgi:2-hydroxy-6-oxonona-2,4-dienedioate hydrolase